MPTPSLLSILPFAIMLACIALMPLIPRTQHWWDNNRNKLLLSLSLSLPIVLYYFFRDFGYHSAHGASDPGFSTALVILKHAFLDEYAPFIVLLFSLFVISGGINLRGDIPAHPITNTIFLALGAGLASFIGTTGAAMLLIRPVLQINSERRHVRHTVIFFIFLVANIGGCLLPIGDPPLFLGYLLGVPFMWTLQLWKEWLFCTVVLLIVYFIWDMIAWRTETQPDKEHEDAVRIPLQLTGRINFLLLLGVVLAAGLIDPSKNFLGTSWKPFPYLREAVLLSLSGLSWALTKREVRVANDFSFHPIAEVAALFIGIFVTMQAPVELLTLKGASLGLLKPWQFFWASGMLSSVLDNAPTYVVFFSTACSLPESLQSLVVQFGKIDLGLLAAISCGSVFMGANTYIGNGPNFMVKSIAERSGVEMPHFFHYMLYSGCVLIPLFILVTFVFF
ncbi:TPA: sodium:proton antiporter [Candidatus Sumerlaeota bacterium]|jgi:Na+/H+ antiporter NhaD/arsenite permease-like protein|nr:sodium:proton antiporter [Candidatus Sumerlaeota bacterium]